MSLRQQQVAVFLGTVALTFGLFAAGVWLISQRLTKEATLHTALVMARQVEIALADSLRQRPVAVQPGPSRASSSSFWNFLGNILPGNRQESKPRTSGHTRSRHAEVKGLMRAFVDRSGSIEAMWVLNAEGKVLYTSAGTTKDATSVNAVLFDSLRRGVTVINTRRQGNASLYDVMVPLQMPEGVRGPGGLRLWINPADWTELLAGMWRQLTLLFALGGSVALVSAFLTTALYTRRFRLISETLRQAEAGTYAARPDYPSRDEVGTSLDLIDRLVMKQRRSATAPGPVQRLAVAARTLAHEVKTPLNALAIHLEVLRGTTEAEGVSGDGEQRSRSIATLDSSIRQVDRLIRDFMDYSAPVSMQRDLIDIAEVLRASLSAIESACAAQKIDLSADLVASPWPTLGDATRLRQAFDNLLRNAMEAQPDGGAIRVATQKDEAHVTIDISDAGPGISDERQAELFEFGKTTKIGGSGIGLPLSQLIAEAHGGQLSYLDASPQGLGATFRFVLPLEVN